jgi:hypothetical protein
MTDFETFVITVYVLVDTTVRQLDGRPARHRGRPPALTCSELLTLALLCQLGRFRSERDFARFAAQRLRAFFPRLPDRSQLHRGMRRLQPLLVTLGTSWAADLGGQAVPYELLDGTAIVLRANNRRGGPITPFTDFTERGKSTRLGWFVGCRLLLAPTPSGVITGMALAPGNTHDSRLAATFFAQRAAPTSATAMVGRPASGRYLADSAFAGQALQHDWATRDAAHVDAPPNPDAAPARQWSRAHRRWHAGARQIIETVFHRLFHGLGLDRDRPHTLLGLLTRLAAKIALHNACVRWNRQQGRPDLAFESVIGW